MHDWCALRNGGPILRSSIHLVGTHCIAHREALAAKDANDEFPCLGFIDRAANKMFE